MRPGAAVLTPIFENIPPELKNLNQWVVWKDDKIPHKPRSVNSKASVTNPGSWSSFEQAKVAYEKGGLLGIGFVFNGNGIAGVDLDGCVIDGKPIAEALGVLQELGATYIEFSPSGTGLHAYGFADNLKSGIPQVVYNNVKVELYTNERYFTITGQVFQSGLLAPFRNFTEFAKKVSQKATDEIEVTKCNTSVSSVSSALPCILRVFPYDA
jgi:primase-polymerase (primpol)-like protein